MYARGMMHEQQQQQTVVSAAAPPSSTFQDAHVPGGMTREQLAHELLLNPGLHMDEKDDNDTSKLVRNKISVTFKPAFWTQVYNDLCAQPVVMERVFMVLDEIRKAVAEVCRGRPVDPSIEEVIDMELIRQLIANNALDYMSQMDSIATVMLAVHDCLNCHERRRETDEKWKAMKQRVEDEGLTPRVIVDALQLLVGFTYVARVDCANIKLRRISPAIQVFAFSLLEFFFAFSLLLPCWRSSNFFWPG